MMAGMKLVPSLGIFFFALATFLQEGRGSSPSIELLFGARPNNGNNQSTTPNPSISERVHATINNVLRIPLPLFGAPVLGGHGGEATPLPPLQAVVEAVVQPLNEIPHQLRQQQQQYSESQGAPPSSFLPDINEAVHSTIQQLSTLSHWPFPYEQNTAAAQQQNQAAQVTSRSPADASTTVAPTSPPQTVPPTQRITTTTTTRPTTTAPSPPPPPPSPSTEQSLPPPPPFSQFVLPPSNSHASSLIFTIGNGGATQETLSPVSILSTSPLAGQSPPSLSNRIHNRIQSTLGNLRLPNLSQIGQPRPLPRITEPPWVTDLLGPTLEPPTTRMPTIGERVQNAVSNVLLFVPATLANFWYQNWGTQQVDRIVQQIQAAATPKPGAPPEPVFATISAKDPNNPFKNFTAENFKNPADLPAIAAFINTNGMLTPTIVHPVVNMTANTIEYHLRGENETTVLWTGMLSNDVFFGNRKRRPGFEEPADMEDDEDEEIRNTVLNIRV